MVYILKFNKPLGNDRHQAAWYVGWCNEGCLEARLAYHRAGRGAAITRALMERGGDFEVVVIIPGATKADERRIKNQKNTARFVRRYLARQASAAA